ncbi:uncharacterized protein LOC114642488 isoform X1 [Erpetoichthys calabaricus]|uniref:uncharacterized protein LOC114642488 isoform X1 n=1 Tax=Erpetoichthys calabaricus TaxID=27687 RepID=UPI00109F042D|nr:uncharacterized protein LOC114642488 isoform X1 [Erpetoichthys calabaricus]
MEVYSQTTTHNYSLNLPELQAVTGQIINNHTRINRKNLTLKPVSQNHPSTYFHHPTSPMTSLRIWQGYCGNIYFDPFKIHKKAFHPPEDRLTKSGMRRNEDISYKRAYSDFQGINTPRTSRFPRLLGCVRQLSILDKNSLFAKESPQLSEDITWITSLGAIGGLQVQDALSKNTTSNFYKDTIKLRKVIVSSLVHTSDNFPRSSCSSVGCYHQLYF